MLFAPLRLWLDSSKNIYRCSWGRLITCQILVEDRIFLEFRMLFWHWRWDVLSKLARGRPSGEARSRRRPRKRKERKPRNLTWRLFGVLRSFRVTQFHLRVDTGDYVWNSYLYPLVYGLYGQRGVVQVNFSGDTELLLLVENRIIKMLRAFIFYPKPNINNYGNVIRKITRSRNTVH